MKEETNPLFEGILSEARESAEEILRQARKEADGIVQAADGKAREAAESESGSYAQRLEALSLKEENSRRNIDRVAELKSLDSANTVVMKAVREELERRIQEPSFSDVLVLWIAEAAIGLDRSEAKVAYGRRTPVTEEMLRKAEAKAEEVTGNPVRLSLNPVRLQGDGVVVSALDGKVSYNNQLEVRMRRFQRDIRRIVQEENARENSRNS